MHKTDYVKNSAVVISLLSYSFKIYSLQNLKVNGATEIEQPSLNGLAEFLRPSLTGSRRNSVTISY